MINEEIKQKILEMFYNGKGALEISRKLGVSRRGAQKIVREEREKIKNGDAKNPVKKPEKTPPKLPERCPKCGRKVILPCIACNTKRKLQKNIGEELPVATIDLNPENRAIYEQIKKSHDVQQSPI